MYAHPHTRPERFSGTRWLAWPDPPANDPRRSHWQDVSARPEGRADGFTAGAIHTHEPLEEDFEAGVGPDPKTLAHPGAEATPDVPDLAVFCVARPFGPAAAPFCVEAPTVGAGVPVASLPEVGAERSFRSFAGETAGYE